MPIITDSTEAFNALLAIPTLSGIVKTKDYDFLINDLEITSAKLKIQASEFLALSAYRIFYVAAFYLSIDRDVQGLSQLDNFKFTNLTTPIKALLDRQAKDDRVLIDLGYVIPPAYVIAPEGTDPIVKPKSYIFSTSFIGLELR